MSNIVVIYIPPSINTVGVGSAAADAHFKPVAVVESAVSTVPLAPTPRRVTVADAVAAKMSPLVVATVLTTASLAISALTNAVVAIWVVSVSTAAVGATGVPVSDGEASGA
jgi:hypothetical protein